MTTKNLLSVTLLVFQASGLCLVPITITSKSLRPVIVRLINVLFIIYLFTSLSASFWYHQTIFDKDSAIGKFTLIIQFASPFTAHIVCIVDAIARKKHHKKLFKSWLAINKFCKELNIDLDTADTELIRNYAIKFLILNLVALAAETRIIVGTYSNKSWFTNWCLKFTPFVFGRIGVSQQIFFVNFVRNRNKCLNDELQIISSSKSQKSFSCRTLELTQKNHKRVEVMKKIQNELTVTMKYINKRFGNSILVAVISNFICLTVSVFWITARATYGKFLLVSFLHSVPPTITLFILFNAANELIEEADKTVRFLHDIKRRADDSDYMCLISEFSLQNVHTKIYVSASSFFNIDHSGLLMICSAIATYSIIFIQSLPSQPIF